MPLIHSIAGRKTIRSMIAGGAVLLVIVAVAFGLVELTRHQAVQLRHVYDMRDSALRIFSLLQDAETGQRGFLLVGRTVYLDPYENALRDLEAEFERFIRLNEADREISDEDLRRLLELKRDKLAELGETLETIKGRGRDEALDIVKSDRGIKIMNEIRAQIDKIVRVADDKKSFLLLKQDEIASTFRWINIAAAGLIVLFAVISIRIVNRHVRDILDARNELDALNHSLEQRIADRTAELSRANDEIQRFTYVVTHDLRAPLVNIMGFASELGRDLALVKIAAHKIGVDALGEEASAAIDRDMPESIGFIQTSTTKMDRLINAILKLSRDGRRELNFERIDMRALLENAKAALVRQIGEANAEVEIAPSLPSVVSDRFSLEQVFTNLLDNAVKYLKPGLPGRISVQGFYEGGDAIIFEVKDNGRGIAPHDQERVFEMFRRSGAAQDRPGEGIGLAHVRHALRRLGGEISVVSEFGQGATFRVRIPNKGT